MALTSLPPQPDSAFVDWQIASDLPGRLRVRQPELIASPLLRHHCRLILTSCHWLLRFRINALAGSVCIDYPHHRRDEVLNLLGLALQLTPLDESLLTVPNPPLSGRKVQKTLLHGGVCATLLALEGLVALPSLVMTGATLLLLWPLTREVIHQLSERRITVETLELSFSGVLVGRGLAAEALVDLAIGDAVEATQNAVDRDDLLLDSDHLLDRLGDAVNLECLGPDGAVQLLPLHEAAVGMTITLRRRQHCFLSARLISGALVVITRLVDGDWRPRTVVAGDALLPGSLVISGEATACIEHCIRSDQAYDLLREHHQRPEPEPSTAERWIQTYRRVMPPVLMGLGGVFLAQGAVERSLAAFQFNPVSDWESHKLAAQITAIADLNLHKLRVRHPQAIESLGTVRHLVISRSCLDRIGGIQVCERIEASNSVRSGSLVQLLAGTQRWLCGKDGAVIWSQQLQQVADPIAVSNVIINDLFEGWRIDAEDGRSWTLRQSRSDAPAPKHPHFLPLEVWQGSELLGRIELIREPDGHWRETCALLQSMGITLHLIASEPVENLRDIATELGISPDHQHGSCTASQRLELVQQLQQQGAVGFVGYVLHDLPAMAQADVSIGLDVDDDSRYLSSICDLSLGADALWLPRLIRISRGMTRACNQNLGLLGASQLVSSLATAAGWIAPLQTVLLADIPLLLAELNNLIAMRTPKSTSPKQSLPAKAH